MEALARGRPWPGGGPGRGGGAARPAGPLQAPHAQGQGPEGAGPGVMASFKLHLLRLAREGQVEVPGVPGLRAYTLRERVERPGPAFYLLLEGSSWWTCPRAGTCTCAAGRRPGSRSRTGFFRWSGRCFWSWARPHQIDRPPGAVDAHHLVLPDAPVPVAHAAADHHLGPFGGEVHLLARPRGKGGVGDLPGGRGACGP